MNWNEYRVLTTEDAKSIILSNVEQEVRHETAQMIKEIEQQAKEEADKKAREIIITCYSTLCGRSCG